jgi:hypothetical protein
MKIINLEVKCLPVAIELIATSYKSVKWFFRVFGKKVRPTRIITTAKAWSSEIIMIHACGKSIALRVSTNKTTQITRKYTYRIAGPPHVLIPSGDNKLELLPMIDTVCHRLLFLRQWNMQHEPPERKSPVEQLTGSSGIDEPISPAVSSVHVQFLTGRFV